MKYRSKEVIPLLEKIFEEHGRAILKTNDFRVLVQDYLYEGGYEAECHALIDVFGAAYTGKRIYEKDADSPAEQKLAALRTVKELSRRFNEKAVMFAVQSVTAALGWPLARESVLEGARLRFVGTVALPSVIHVHIPEGGAFSVGRFDVSLGRKQSDFEFDPKTRGVSRRHAVIEHDANGYTLSDLSSSAGTFADGNRLAPHTPFPLEHGLRVSFGASGADYIWEEYS